MDTLSSIKILVEHAIPNFYKAFLVLFVNYDLFPRFFDENGMKRIVVIEGVNNLSTNEIETVSLAAKKWNDRTKDIQLKIKSEEEEVKKWLLRLTDILLNPRKIPSSLLSKEIIEGVTSELITQCISEYRVQSDVFDKKNVIRQLVKMGILEAWSQASVCGNCDIFELLLSSLPRKNSDCPKCKQRMTSIRIYKFEKNYENIKAANGDLPEFIKMYIINKVSGLNVETSYPLTGITGGDIDVYVPNIKTGFECKLFVNPIVEGNSLKSRIGEFVDSFKKFIEYGNVERLIAITNLDPKYKLEIETGIKAGLGKSTHPYSELKVVCSSVEDLMTLLDEEIQYVKSLQK